jgi:hypothetical protein
MPLLALDPASPFLAASRPIRYVQGARAGPDPFKLRGETASWTASVKTARSAAEVTLGRSAAVSPRGSLNIDYHDAGRTSPPTRTRTEIAACLWLLPYDASRVCPTIPVSPCAVVPSPRNSIDERARRPSAPSALRCIPLEPPHPRLLREPDGLGRARRRDMLQSNGSAAGGSGNSEYIAQRVYRPDRCSPPRCP